ncbi:sortase [Candidatus Saccharibacteria bacterium]|nr:sortase [Candidatus Saccharibacteria bacterium]
MNKHDNKSLDLRRKPANDRKEAKQNTATIGQTKKPGFLKRNKRLLLVLLAIVLIGIAIYVLFLLLWPKVQKKSAKEIYSSAQQATSDTDMVFIPSAGIQAEIAEGGADQLDRGKAWHRFPDRGDPQKGGNFIITGHSFVWGYSPGETSKKSIFYSLGDAKPGDEVIVRWNKQMYNYTITDKQTVKPTEVAIEAASKIPQLTIYTCTQGGTADGRIVLVAKSKS